jgi:hypothetical protein
MYARDGKFMELFCQRFSLRYDMKTIPALPVRRNPGAADLTTGIRLTPAELESYQCICVGDCVVSGSDSF